MEGVKVYKAGDIEVTGADAEALLSKYGIKCDRVSVPVGSKVWRLRKVKEQFGTVSHITRVVDSDGEPMENVSVAFYWPAADVVPEDERYPTDYYDNFVYGPTNVSGDVGPGMGGGAAFPEGGCGPHQVWVRHPEIKSDLVRCVGWLAGTNHDHMNIEMALEVEQGDGGNGETPPIDGTIASLHRQIGDLHHELARRYGG